jgi:hypothetical protein
VGGTANLQVLFVFAARDGNERVTIESVGRAEFTNAGQKSEHNVRSTLGVGEIVSRAKPLATDVSNTSRDDARHMRHRRSFCRRRRVDRDE